MDPGSATCKLEAEKKICEAGICTWADIVADEGGSKSWGVQARCEVFYNRMCNNVGEPMFEEGEQNHVYPVFVAHKPVLQGTTVWEVALPTQDIHNTCEGDELRNEQVQTYSLVNGVLLKVSLREMDPGMVTRLVVGKSKREQQKVILYMGRLIRRLE